MTILPVALEGQQRWPFRRPCSSDNGARGVGGGWGGRRNNAPDDMGRGGRGGGGGRGRVLSEPTSTDDERRQDPDELVTQWVTHPGPC